MMFRHNPSLEYQIGKKSETGSLDASLLSGTSGTARQETIMILRVRTECRNSGIRITISVFGLEIVIYIP